MPTPTRRAMYLARELDRYRMTSKPLKNEWTDGALRNVMMTRVHMETACAALMGVLTSVYRSAQVNAAVGGAKGSRHLLGLACDILPGTPWKTVEEASQRIWAMALEQKLGLVQQVIQEPTWVHVGWYSPTEPDKGMTLMRKMAQGYKQLASWQEQGG